VANVGDEPSTWWHDEHTLVAPTYRCERGSYTGGSFGSNEVLLDIVPPHWHTSIEIHPGARVRRLTGVDSVPDGTTFDRVFYEVEDDRYELVADEAELTDPSLR
jgi:hypothetical protein